MDKDDFLKFFKSQNEIINRLVDEIRLKKSNGSAAVSKIYTPVSLFDEVIYETKRRAKEQEIRLNLIPDLKGRSVLDVGTNSGFILINLKKRNNIGKSLGIDLIQEIIDIPKAICEIESLNLDFKVCNVSSDEFLKLPSFDYSLVLSIWGSNVQILHQNLERIKKKTKRSIFIEPTNHSNIDDYVSYWIKELSIYGSVKDLGETDYQNRHIYQVDLQR